ncbi:hypothetical protein GCM10010402_83110 [Actinomadura luteofluorescens]
MLARETWTAPVPVAGREAGRPGSAGGRQGAMLKRVTPHGHGRRPSVPSSSSLMMTKGVSWV